MECLQPLPEEDTSQWTCPRQAAVSIFCLGRFRRRVIAQGNLTGCTSPCGPGKLAQAFVLGGRCRPVRIVFCASGIEGV